MSNLLSMLLSYQLCCHNKEVWEIYRVELSFHCLLRFKNKLKRIGFHFLVLENENDFDNDDDDDYDGERNGNSARLRYTHERLSSRVSCSFTIYFLVVCQLSIHEVRSQLSGLLALFNASQIRFFSPFACVWNFTANCARSPQVTTARGNKNITITSSERRGSRR